MLLDVYADPTVVPQRGQRVKREAEAPHTGETRMMAMFEAVQDAQDLSMQLDRGVFFLGEDIGDDPGGVFKCFKGMQTKWGERVRPTPIAEQAIIGAATGAALVGMRPVAEIMFCDFVGVCLDQIINHAAKQRYMSGGATHVPMTVRMIAGGGIGGFGAQHSQSTEAMLLHNPGLKIVYPSTPTEAKGLLLSCIFDEDPCIQFESMMLTYALKEEVPLGDYRIPLGVAKVKREGSDVTLITYGWQVMQCLKAAEELAEGRHQRRGAGPAHAAAAGLRPHPGVGGKNRAGAGGSRGDRVLWSGRRDRQHHQRGAVPQTEGTRLPIRCGLRADRLFQDH